MLTIFTKVAHAASGNAAANAAVDTLLAKINDNIVTPLVALVFALATLLFIWGIFEFMFSSGDPGKRAQGSNHILWGVVGMFIMVSVYGIIRLVLSTVGVEDAPF